MPGITVQRAQLSTGISLRVLECGPAAGTPIVLIHGWAVSSYLWRHNIGTLAEAGHRVVALDLPGHGLSDVPTAAGSYTLSRFSAHLDAALDALGLVRAFIAAQSLGARVALRLALDVPERVSGLMLFGPVGFGLLPPWKMLAPIIPPLPDAVMPRLVPRRIVEFVQRRVHGKLGRFSARDVDEYWAPTQFPEIVRAQLQMLREFEWSSCEPEALAKLRMPVHVVFGTRDRTVRPVYAERLVALIPQGRLTWIPDAGHVVMEEAPDMANALILDAERSTRLDSAG